MSSCRLLNISCLLICVVLGAGEITSDQMIDGFISYVQKAESTTLNKEQIEQQRRVLKAHQDNQLITPYRFDGDRLDRGHIVDLILADWAKIANRSMLSKSVEYAGEKQNLVLLSDEELVVAYRVVEGQLAKKHKVVQVQLGGGSSLDLKDKIVSPTNPADNDAVEAIMKDPDLQCAGQVFYIGEVVLSSGIEGFCKDGDVVREYRISRGGKRTDSVLWYNPANKTLHVLYPQQR